MLCDDEPLPTGGELLFLDEPKDSQLEPKEGQLVFFSSGLETLAALKVYLGYSFLQ